MKVDDVKHEGLGKHKTKAHIQETGWGKKKRLTFAW